MMDIRDGRCPLCKHGEVVEAVPAEFSQGQEVVAAAAYHPSFLFGRNPSKPYGRLKFFFCRKCGYAVTFVEDPGAVPIGRDFYTRIITAPESGEPYR